MPDAIKEYLKFKIFIKESFPKNTFLYLIFKLGNYIVKY